MSSNYGLSAISWFNQNPLPLPNWTLFEIEMIAGFFAFRRRLFCAVALTDSLNGCIICTNNSKSAFRQILVHCFHYKSSVKRQHWASSEFQNSWELPSVSERKKTNWWGRHKERKKFTLVLKMNNQMISLLDGMLEADQELLFSHLENEKQKDEKTYSR